MQCGAGLLFCEGRLTREIKVCTDFAGVENELFHKENTMMLFGDARASVESLIAEMREL